MKEKRYNEEEIEAIYSEYEKEMDLCQIEEDIHATNHKFIGNYGKDVIDDLMNYIFSKTHY